MEEQGAKYIFGISPFCFFLSLVRTSLRVSKIIQCSNRRHFLIIYTFPSSTIWQEYHGTGKHR